MTEIHCRLLAERKRSVSACNVWQPHATRLTMVANYSKIFIQYLLLQPSACAVAPSQRGSSVAAGLQQVEGEGEEGLQEGEGQVEQSLWTAEGRRRGGGGEGGKEIG